MAYNPIHDISSHSISAFESEKDSQSFELSHHGNDDIQPSNTNFVRPIEASILNTASQFSIYINLTSTMIGVGILSLPYAFSRTGYILGIFLLSFCALQSYLGVQLMYACAIKTKLPSSFSAVAKISSLSYLSILIDSAIFLKCIGVSTSYPIVVGDLMPAAFRQLFSVSESEESSNIVYNRHFWIFLSFLVCAPLCTFKSLDALKWTSLVSVMFIIISTLLFIAYCVRLFGLNPCDEARHSIQCSDEVTPANFSIDVIRVFSVFIFVFTCQHNSFAVVNELKNPTEARATFIFNLMIITTLLIYITLGVSGYFTYGFNVLPNALKSYPDSPEMSLVRIFFSFIVIFHFPLQCNPGRRSLMSIWNKLSGDLEPGPSTIKFRFNAITVFFVLFCFSVAMIVENLGITFQLVGATGSTATMYLIPGLCYYNLHKHQGSSWMRAYSVFHVCFGLLVIPLTLTFIFLGE